jgi:hypothetical protein
MEYWDNGMVGTTSNEKFLRGYAQSAMRHAQSAYLPGRRRPILK